MYFNEQREVLGGIGGIVRWIVAIKQTALLLGGSLDDGFSELNDGTGK